MLKEIDLNDPTTKALYDFYPEDKKEEFQDAYAYMKYFTQTVSTLKTSLMPDRPQGKVATKALEKASPEVLEHMQKYAAKYVAAFNGGYETSFYNAKVVSLNDIIKLVTVDVDVNLEIPRTVIPFKRARNIILKGNPAIAIGQCPCRSVMPEEQVKCIPYPYEACMFVGEPFVSFIVAHHGSFRKISTEEAVAILEKFHEMGFSHQAYFKADMGDRFYAICNCCPCCCPSVLKTNLELDGIIPFTNSSPSGLVAVIGDDCTGCGACVEKCLYHAIKLNEDETRAEVIFDRCQGCGVCEGQCPVEAITLRAEPAKGGMLNLDELRKTTEARI